MPLRKLKNIAQVSDEVGIAKDLLRMWERRYGFPKPQRDENGDRVFCENQFAKLCLIKRLMEMGHRPGHLMSSSTDELEKLVHETVISKRCPTWVELIDLLKHKTVSEIENHFRSKIQENGLQNFLIYELSKYHEIVGNAWVAGELTIYEEHLYSEVIETLLREQIQSIPSPKNSVKVLMTTLPGELHRLGLLTAHLFLKLHGAEVVNLGAELPVKEIVFALQRHNAEVLALSISINYKPQLAQKHIQTLIKALNLGNIPKVEVWCGGLGSLNLKETNEFKILKSLEQIKSVINEFNMKRVLKT